MIANRRPRWPVLLALLTAFAGSVGQPLSAETDAAGADDAPIDARVERLREAIEREREALERERATRRSMEDELDRMREELESTREQLEELERETGSEAGAGN